VDLDVEPHLAKMMTYYGSPLFVKKDVVILIEASIKNQCKGKTMRLHCLCLSFSNFFLII
jgi:hypothetical protein